MNWNDLRFFLAVAREGGLSPAARRLGSSVSRIARRVETLEAALGTPLFHRGPEGYRLTEEGRGFLPRAEAVEAAARAVEGKAALGADVAGRVRLATAETFATALIAPELPGFFARYPNVALEIVTGLEPVDLARYDADLALRLVRPEAPQLRVRRLGHMAVGLYRAAGAAADRHVAWHAGFAGLPVQRAAAELDGAPRLTANSLAVHLAAVRSGAVAGLLPCFLADPDPALMRLRIVPEAGQDIWLALNPDAAVFARVRAVADFVVEIVERRRPLLAGDGPG